MKSEEWIETHLICIRIYYFIGITPTSSDLEQRLGLFGYTVNRISPFKYTFEFQVCTPVCHLSFQRILSLNELSLSLSLSLT
jgi:hypothetical protein